MRFGRRRARSRHPASRRDLDLAALWDDGEDEDAPDEDRVGADAGQADRGDVAAETGSAVGAGSAAPPLVAPRRRPPSGGRRQAAAVGLVACALAGGLIADRAVGSGTVPVAAAPPPAMPSTAAAGAMSSAWYCPALGASATSQAKGRVIIANPTATTITATVTVVPSSGAQVISHPVLAPYSRTTVRLEDVAPGAYAAATVAFEGAAGAVEQEVQGPLGQSITACASSSSNRWYLATGATDANATEYLSLYNPYPAAAIADLSFETDQGPSTPDAFQGVVVPGGGFNVVDIGSRVRSRAQVSALVNVRSGRLVVDKVQILANRARSGPRGLVLTLGVPALGTSWYFADGRVNTGVTERFDVFNPGNVEADVSAAPILEQGSADPFNLTVPPQGMISLQVDQQPRIPPGVGQAWVLTSTNGVGVVAERVITSGPPAAATGVADTTGASAPARRWVFPEGSAANGADEWLVVFDPGAAPAHVSVVASGAGQATVLPALVIGPGSRQAVDIGRIDPAGIVVLDVGSDVPIVAERRQFATTGAGMSNATGIAGG
jgi:hypothetical protein